LLGQRDQAREHIKLTLELDAHCAEAHCNLAMLLLGEGQHAAGWAEYQWYAQSKSYYGSRFTEPAWDGSPLAGRTILIVCDHGLGDTLQFVRYLSWLRRRGAGRILLAAQTALWPLLKESGFGDLVSLDEGPLQFDVHAATVMLPALFYAQERSIGASEPYLRAASELVERWRSRLAQLDGFKIGVCWQGSRDFIWSETRSVPLAEMAPLGELPGVCLVSLQVGEGRQQLSAVADRFRVVDFPEDLDRLEGPFMDTAAIIKNLDLVITSDTSVAHVAGGLGASVWLALSSTCDWRWEQRGEATAWYPNMRLFRQPAPGDWPSVFHRMAGELRRFTS
jgi:hypothetical protein